MGRLKHILQINILFGAWLVGAPFILGYSASTLELANDVALGAVLLGGSWWILAAAPGSIGASVLQLLGGLWLVAAPFYFHYDKLSRVYNNDVVVGMLSLLLSATATWMLASRLRRLA